MRLANVFGQAEQHRLQSTTDECECKSAHCVRGKERHTLQPPPRNTPHVTAEIQIETNGQSNTVYEG